MSVESDVQSGTQAAAAPAAAANPALLGLAGFLPAGITLGLWLIGYLPAADLGGMIPAVLGSAGLFLLIAAVAALRAGASVVAGIFGAFSAFWLSLGLMLAGLTNGWFGLTATSNPLPTFLVSWLIVFVLLTVATLRLPLAFTAGFAFVDITVALLLTSILSGTAILQTLAGVTCFIFCAIYAYILVDAFGQELGGKAMAMGNAIQR
jgi:hypothetical protein